MSHFVPPRMRPSHHINVKYYHIKDCYECQELDIKYCPTDKMVADYFTKPLQGEKFYAFRKMIMNL